jgi:hypothetical protein
MSGLYTVDTTGTTYTHLQGGRHLNHFLYLFQNNLSAYLGCPSLLFLVCLLRSQGKYDGNRALPTSWGDSRTMFNWNVIRVVTRVSRRVFMHT